MFSFDWWLSEISKRSNDIEHDSIENEKKGKEGDSGREGGSACWEVSHQSVIRLLSKLKTSNYHTNHTQQQQQQEVYAPVVCSGT